VFVAALVTLPLEVAGLQVNPEEVAYTGSQTVSTLELSIVMLMIGLLLLVMASTNRRL
jgi:hypothetical protein